MARFTVELPILGVQRTNVEGKIYAKVFVGEEPDGQTEQISSIMVMPIREDMADEVFASAQNLSLGQLVRLHVETARGRQQSVRNEVCHIEPVRAAVQQPGQPAKPADAPKP